MKLFPLMSFVHVRVCVCVREREREREKKGVSGNGVTEDNRGGLRY